MGTPAHLKGLVGQSLLNAEMQAGFSLADENQSRMTRWSIENEACQCGHLTHPVLLRPFPSVEIGKHEVGGCLDLRVHMGAPLGYTSSIYFRVHSEITQKMLIVPLPFDKGTTSSVK